VHGKDMLPQNGEYNEMIIVEALQKLTGKAYKCNLNAHCNEYKKIDIIKRPPVLCAGCPHRATFYATKLATQGMDVVFGGDIGCYILGVIKPVEVLDYIFDMGAAQGLSHGIRKSTDQKTISFLGDSTFFHSGIPALVNAVYNKSDQLVMILDNSITAMTGHQPNPGMGVTGMGDATTSISIEGVVRSLGVENLKVVDPFNIKEMVATMKEFLNSGKLSVIIAKRECQLTLGRRMKAEGRENKLKFEIDQDKCDKIGACLNKYSCPAMYKKEGKYHINPDICVGCASCVQVCPKGAIKPKVKR
jgi:indolepyruvate ferredoxin oxidoreductase alpha subunit